MIDGLLITRSLEKLMAKGRLYYPGMMTSSSSCRMPATMRDLIEFNFDGMLGSDGDVDLNIRHINWPKQSQSRLSRLPVLASDLNRKLSGIATDEKPEVEMDYRGEAPALAAFYNWLLINEPNHGIDVDHPLEGHGYSGWPLWGHFADTLLKKTGYTHELIFCYLYEAEGNTGEPEVWDRAFLPLFDIGAGGNDVPLLEFLNEFVGWSGEITNMFMPEFPQAVYELGRYCAHTREVEAGRLIFREVLLDGRIELLDEKWATALTGLDEYGKDKIYLQDWWDDGTLILDGSSHEIDELFERLNRIKKMRDAVDPLVDEFMVDSEKFWKKFLEKLHVINVEYPSLAETVRTRARPRVKVST